MQTKYKNLPKDIANKLEILERALNIYEFYLDCGKNHSEIELNRLKRDIEDHKNQISIIKFKYASDLI